MKKKIFYLFVISLVFIIGCSDRKEQAHIKLSEQGINFNISSYLSYIMNGDLTVVRLFLTAGMNPNTVNDYGQSSLALAAGFGHLNITKELLNYGAKVNTKDNFGQTPLIAGAFMGHNDIVIELLKRGAQIDEQDNNKRTALIYASKNGHRGS